jgi:hypothetical protein
MRHIPLVAVTILGILIGSIPRAGAEELPIPPVPPEHPFLADNAPLPNFDARPPLVPISTSPTFDVRVLSNKRYDPSLGFAPGSRYQTNEDRRPIQPPGLSVSVPLQ